MFSISTVSIAQAILDPVDSPYFVIQRKTGYVNLPDSLAGNKATGFAGLTILVDSKGKFVKSELHKLKLNGPTCLSYEAERDKYNNLIKRYHKYLNTIIKEYKIVKVDKRIPPESSRISFIVRFK